MKKFVLAAAVAVLAGTLAASAAPAVEPPAEPIQVTNFGKKAPVTFDHAKHTGEGFTCVQCHHRAAEGAYKCGQCHGEKASGETPKLRDAAHAKDRGACYSCHLASGAEHKFKCSDCHRG